MLFRMLYDDKLAQAAYLIGCQRTGEAIVIDPERDADRYIAAARAEGLRITAVAETHIHADYLSGARELAERTGAKVYLSDEGGADWKYLWVHHKSSGGDYPHQLLKHHDTFSVGNIDFTTLHTPGHTPEHIAFLVTDRGSGAAEPMGIVSGDFVFVGDLGRPDLLETAAGHAGVKESSARQLRESARAFLDLPDFLQVWPAHGAGSACGKALGAVPQSTVGYEKRFNPLLRIAQDEARFVDSILDGQPEPPLYFARMKRENKSGPALLGALPKPRALTPADLADLTPDSVILDTRPWPAFRAAHLKGALSAPLDKSFPTIAGSYIDPRSAIILIAEPHQVAEAVRDLINVGLDRITAYATPDTLNTFTTSNPSRAVSTPEIDVAAAKSLLNSASPPFLLDVRKSVEFTAGHLPGATNAVHVRLPESLDRLPKNRPILVSCQGGMRSARACSLLQRHGFNVTNLAGGFGAWAKSGGPVEK
ncbi:MAG: MBL fold metallo-hydrolase [Phycisphaeraceae bacterium]|nr:MBL fold metallo-hydrolase [Phycisphaeraceae bacterium]